MTIGLGISLSICGHLMQNVGTNILKVSYRIKANGCINNSTHGKDGEEDKSGSSRRMDESVNPLAMDISSAVDWNMEKRMIRTWYGGFAVFKLGALLTFIALAFGPQSLLTSFTSVQFVSNVACGYFMHNEKITNLVVTGTIIIITGITLIVIAGSKTSTEYSMSEAVKLFEEDAYVIYICIAIVIAALSIVVYFKMSKLLDPRIKFFDVLGNNTSKPLADAELKEKSEGQDSKQYFYSIYSNPLTQDLDDRTYEASIPRHLMTDTKDESPLPTIIASSNLVHIDVEPSSEALPIESGSKGGHTRDDSSAPASPTAKDPLNAQKSSEKEATLSREISRQNGIAEGSRMTENSDQTTSIDGIRITSFALYSAIIGTQVVSFAKLVSLAVFNTLDGNNQFNSPFTYLFLVLMVAFGIFWDYQLNKGVRVFDAAIIIPMLQCFWTLFSITNGGVLFQEFSSLSSKQVGLFVTGVVLMLGGVSFLLMRPAKPSSDEKTEQGVKGRHQRTSIISEVLHIENNEETSLSNSLVAMSTMSGMLLHKGILSGEPDSSRRSIVQNPSLDQSWPGTLESREHPALGNSCEVSNLFEAPVNRARQDSSYDIRVQRALQIIKRKFQRPQIEGRKRKEKPTQESPSRLERNKNVGKNRTLDAEKQAQEAAQTI